MDEDDWMIVAIVTGVVGLLILLFAGVIKETDERFVMPNGVICEKDKITTSSFGAATHEFYECEDQLTYINPATYERIITKT